MAQLIHCKRSGYEPHLSQFEKQVGSLWENYFGRKSVSLGETAEYDAADFDIQDEDDEIVVRAELPGFEPGDIAVELRNGELMIRAQRNQREGKQGQPCQRLVHAEYSRTVALPPNTRTQSIRAIYDRGVLELHLPRAS